MGCQHSQDATATGADDERPSSELSYFSTVNIFRGALAAAVATGDISLADAILTRQPQLVYSTINELSLVHCNCTDARRDMLRVVLLHGASADDGLDDGLSALHLAVLTAQVRAVEVLLEFGASVNAPTRLPGQPLDSMTPLHLAARRGSVEIAQVLLASGPIDLMATDALGFTAAQTAIARPSGFPVFRLLHSLGLVENVTRDPAGYHVPFLVLAVRPNNLPAIQYLLHHGTAERIVDAVAADSGVTPLMVAAAEGLTEVVELLIAHGANVNAVRSSEPVNSTALFEAAYEGHDAIVAMLLRAGARYDLLAGENGMSALHAACSYGHLACIELLCLAGANVNMVSRHRHPDRNQGDDALTPMHLAAFDGHYDAIDVLVQFGAVVDAPSALGETPLQLAAKHGHAAFVSHVLDTYNADVDVNHRDADGATSLHKAVTMRHFDVTCVLLRHGADVNASLPTSHLTPLHIAVMAGDVEVARVLLESGANDQATNDTGDTPLQTAKDHGHDELVALLQSVCRDSAACVAAAG